MSRRRLTAEVVDGIAREVRHATYSAIGEPYLSQLAKELRGRLALHTVFVGLVEPHPYSRIRTYAVSKRGADGRNFEYALDNTPCAGVTTGEPCVYSDAVADAFPLDVTLREGGIRAYAGQPLRGSTGEIIGLLVALDDAAFDDPALVLRLLEDLAARAGAELEWVRKDEALRATEQRYRRMLDALAEGIVVTEVDGTIVDCNESALAILGLRREHLLGRSLLDASWETLNADGSPMEPGERPTIARAFRDAAPAAQTIGVRHPDGTPRWLRINARPLSLASGRTSGAVVSFEDVTGRLQVERHLADTATRLNLVIDASTDGIWEWQLASGRVTLSSRVYALLDLEREAFGGTVEASLAFVHPNDREGFDRAIEAHLADGVPIDVELRLRRGDGSYGYFRIRATSPHERGRLPERIAGSINDVTNSRRLERLLDQTQHVAHVAGWEVDLNTARIYLTPYARELLEVDPDWEPTRDGILSFFPPSERERLRQGFREAATTGAAWTADVEITTARDRQRWVRFIMGHEAREGELRRAFGTAQDITAERLREEEAARLEAQLLHAQKMEAIGTLAGGIAHDFNNILAAIVGHAEIARFDASRTDQVERSLDEILRASERARDLVSQILTFSRKQVQARQPMRLSVVLREALTLLRATVPVTIELATEIAEKEPFILGDGTRLHQVLLNLATNASHAIGSRPGAIRFRLDVQTHAGDPLLPRRLPEGRYVRLTVSDTGSGMDDATLERAFEPFFTTKRHGEGSGLGLSVVLGIVESHDGAVTVESHRGRGTTFHLYFPALDERPASEVPAATGPRGPAARVPGRVLFIDDEVAILDVGRRMLARLGLQCETYSHPSSGLAAFRADPARWDLVITDLALPGIAGTTVAETIQDIRPGMPVVLTTGYAGALTAEEQAQSTILAVLHKPFSFADLAALVQRVLPSAP